MSLKKTAARVLHHLRIGLTALAVFQFSLGGPLAGSLQAHENENENGHTRTPIKHVIVLIGENRTFDHLFATYVPKSRDSVSNLLSKGIINADGTPGPHFKKAEQFQAVAPFRSSFFISLGSNEKAPYSILPEPTLNFSPNGSTPPPFPGCDTNSAAGSRRAIAGNRRSASPDHRRVRGQQHVFPARPGYARTEFQRAPERTVSTRRAKSSLRFLYRRYDSPAVRNVAAIGLQHCKRHEAQSFRMLERPLSLRHHQLYESDR